MAIEKQNNQPEVQLEGTEDMTVALEAIEESGEQDFEIQEDGSAVLVGAEEPVALGFDSNLAEALDEGELSQIANSLRDGIEKDKASREDWEKTYTDGLKYLGMKFDQDRSEPFEGASQRVALTWSQSSC